MSFKDIFTNPQLGGILTGPEIMKQIRNGRITITPFDAANINPNSYNLHTGDHVTIYDHIQGFDLKTPMEVETVTYKLDDSGFIMRPGMVYLIPTAEEIGSDYYEPIFTGRSSMGRLGITIHQEAGFADIGFHGQLTMQVKVTYPTKIYSNIPIAQIYFLTAIGTIKKYNGRYQNSKGAIASKGVIN